MRPYYLLKRDPEQRFVFSLVGADQEVVLTSEGYERKSSALKGIRAVQRNCLRPERYRALSSADRGSYFVLRSTNNKIIGISRMFPDARSRSDGMEAVRRAGGTVRVQDLT
ncbi:MAG: YegP family protein [Planctomycetota bacterium]